MNKVFIGGSRRITKLPSSVAERIDNIINNNLTVLIGDANGADKCAQTYLAEKSYKNVVVFCMEGRCRNNIGNWEQRIVTANQGETGFQFYALKDQLMAQEASVGLMIWDGKSNGTLNNVLNLLTGGKKAVVYFSSTDSFYTLRHPAELAELLTGCDERDLAEFERKLDLTHRLKQPQPELEFA